MRGRGFRSGAGGVTIPGLGTRLFLLIAVLSLMGAGCASYRPAPLPAQVDLARGRGFDDAALKVAAGELRHPLLRPVVIDLSQPIDPDQAAVLAVLVNPDLKTERDARAEAEAQLVVAGLLPNPVLNLEATHPSDGTGEKLVDTWALSLSEEVNAVLTRSPRRSAARAELEQVDLAIAWREWQVAQSARLLTVRLAWLRNRLEITRGEIAFEDETEKILEKAVAAGDATIAQLGVVRASLEATRRMANEIEQAQTETLNSLLALFGRPAGFHLEVVPAALPATARAELSMPADRVTACLKRRLDLEALRRGYDVQEARVRQAVLDQFPAVSIGLTRQRNENSVRFMGGFVTLGLPLFDLGRARVTLENATRSRLRHEYEARTIAARAEIEGAEAEIAILGRQLSMVEASLAPLAALEEHERLAAARADIDRLSYQAVRSSLLDQRLQEAALSQALAEAGVGLEMACGGTPASEPGTRGQNQ